MFYSHRLEEKVKVYLFEAYRQFSISEADAKQKKIDSRLWKRFSAFIRNCQNFRLFVFLLVRNDQNVFGWFICLCHPMAGKATLQFCPFRSSVVSLFIISSRFAHIQRRPDDFNLTKSSGELISSDEKCDNWMHFSFAQRTPFSVSSR